MSYRGRIETITPEMAEKWLELNTANRAIVQSRVDALVADIKAGKWILTGDPIRFAENGEMIDGQHRLWAIYYADQAVQSYVVRGLPIEAKLVIDSGTKRTLAHYFQITKEKNAPLLAGILNIVWLYDKDRFSTNQRGPTHSEAETFLANMPELRDSVEIAQRVRRGVQVASSPVGAAHAINARFDPEASDEFWNRVADGVGLEAGNTVLAYRRWTAKMLASRTDRPTPRTQFAHAMKAMAAYRAGKHLRLLSWSVGDPIAPDWGMKK